MDDHKDVDFGSFLGDLEASGELEGEVLEILISELVEIGYVKIVGAIKGNFIYDLTPAGAQRAVEIRNWLNGGPYPNPPDSLKRKK